MHAQPLRGGPGRFFGVKAKSSSPQREGWKAWKLRCWEAEPNAECELCSAECGNREITGRRR